MAERVPAVAAAFCQDVSQSCWSWRNRKVAAVVSDRIAGIVELGEAASLCGWGVCRAQGDIHKIIGGESEFTVFLRRFIHLHCNWRCDCIWYVTILLFSTFTAEQQTSWDLWKLPVSQDWCTSGSALDSLVLQQLVALSSKGRFSCIWTGRIVSYCFQSLTSFTQTFTPSWCQCLMIQVDAEEAVASPGIAAMSKLSGSQGQEHQSNLSGEKPDGQTG